VKNNPLFSAGVRLVLLALLSGCVTAPNWQWTGGEQLTSCTGKDGPFEKTDMEKWPETYHGMVSKVIEAHTKKMENLSAAEIVCTAEDYPSMFKASAELQGLASTLEPWKKRTVSELELAPVLLEYLRVYECSLEEKRYFLTIEQQRSSSSSSAGTEIGYGKFLDDKTEDETLINRELASARPILERTLSIVGGLDRLKPLAMDIECIKRASVDLRNGLGLVAEAASCMPRAIDARGSLRDLAKSPSEQDE
jgi:hypothetical protein